MNSWTQIQILEKENERLQREQKTLQELNSLLLRCVLEHRMEDPDLLGLTTIIADLDADSPALQRLHHVFKEAGGFEQFYTRHPSLKACTKALMELKQI